MSNSNAALSRWRLAALWLAQCLHFFANYGLRIGVVFHLARSGAETRNAAFHLSAAIFMAPSIVLVPLYGALSNSLPKRTALAASALLCASVTLGLAIVQDGWLTALAMVALGSALYTPTRYAMLPAAALDTGWPLQRILSAVETGAVLAMVAGMAAYAHVFHETWESVGLEHLAETLPPPALTMLAAAHGLSFLLSLLVWFPSDVYRSESPMTALRGFGRDALRIWRMATTRDTLLGVTTLRVIVTAAAGAFVADALAKAAGDTRAAFAALMAVLFAGMLGAAVGALIASIGRRPERSLAWTPLSVSGMLAAMIWAAAFPPVPLWLCFVVGICGGFVNVPLLATFQQNVPADARGNGMAILNTAGFLGMTVVSAVFAGLARFAGLEPDGQLWIVAALVAIVWVVAWVMLGNGAKREQRECQEILR